MDPSNTLTLSNGFAPRPSGVENSRTEVEKKPASPDKFPSRAPQSSLLWRLAREPLLHFLLIGLALFLSFGRGASDETDARRIVVSQAQLELLSQQFATTWHRQPTDQERSHLAETYVHDEILYREGRLLGLDRDDPVIKRRVRQKLELMAEEISGGEIPSDAELATYLQANQSTFTRPALVTFEQIFLGSEGSDGIDRRLAAARVAAEHGRSPETFGQPTLLPPREDMASVDLVAKRFGGPFAAQLETVPLDQWTGPVVSGFGVHLVRVRELVPAALPSLKDVRSLVTGRWESERRTRALEEHYRRLRQGYQVTIETMQPVGPLQ
ncbi:MAG: peptidyl-prolyl cis-trans isomerase [Nitrospira sp.]|nr:peptidyl-prolyl cis-trans isomerase [Nitrospira sp.]